MKKSLFYITVICTFLYYNASAQKSEAEIKNFIGASFGLDVSSAGPQFEAGYQRIIYPGKFFNWGFTANYKRTRTGLFCIFCSDDNEILNQWGVLINGNLYANRSNKPSGFFVHAGAGAAYITLQTHYEPSQKSLISPVFETGFGVSSPVIKKLNINIQWKNSGGIMPANFERLGLITPIYYINTGVAIGF